MHNILHGDCLEVMETFSDNHFTSIVTDPPYGLKFMGKKWDHGVPGFDFWKEMLRICKPGAIVLAFGGSRTYHRLACAIEDAGWEIRDCLMWLYGSGFPKSHNNFGLEGYGTALKPAYEPIIMAMKPLDGTFAQNVEKWGLGGLNIDESRVETNDNWKRINRIEIGLNGEYLKGKKPIPRFSNPQGRWPANILLDEEAAKQLDEQSGVLKSGKVKPLDNKSKNSIYSSRKKANINNFESTSGGASRFFYCAKASPSERNEGLDHLPIGQSIGGGGTNNTEDDVCEKYGSIKHPSKNFHPTVKPLKLMKYLINLIMPPENGLLLDPFAGSGSTILAAKQLGFEAIGIEREAEYVKIAEARLEASKTEDDSQLELFKID